VFRWYSAGWGRYTQADPVGLKTDLNLYSYVSGRPTATSDPFGLCKIEVRFADLSGGRGAWHHAYVLATDQAGTRYYRGGPGARPSTPLTASAIGLTKHAGQESATPRGHSGAFGTIQTELGDHAPNTVDWDAGTPPAVEALNNNCRCDAYAKCFEKVLSNIQNARVPYDPTSSNSNAVASTLLQQCLGRRFSPPVFSPGWNYPLF
jgi:hypothetical protein